MHVARNWARAAVCLLLAGSGMLSVAAARERWWPACTWGAFDAPGCEIRQDHRYDFVLPADPWVPVGNAAELAGLALLALALAVGVLAWLLVGSRPYVASTASAVLSLPLVLVAAATWLSGQAGQVVDPPLLVPAVLAWAFLWPLALIAVVGVSFDAGGVTGPPVGTRVLLLCFLCASGPVGQVFVAPAMVGYASYDTSPWAEATSGALLVVAGLLAWPATGRGRRERTRPEALPSHVADGQNDRDALVP